MPGARWRARVVAIAVVVVLTACHDTTAPAPLGSIPLRIERAADWFAYRNEGGAWTVAKANGLAYEFLATPRVAVAWGLNRESSPRQINVLYTTADAFLQEAAARDSSSALVAQYAGTVTGTVVNMPARFAYAQVGHGTDQVTSAVADALTPTFTLPAWRAPADLVASLLTWTGAVQDNVRGTRLILRRNQRLAAGAQVTLDFSSPDAIPLDSATLSWTGPDLFGEVFFVSALGSRTRLGNFSGAAPPSASIARTRTVSRVPPDRLVPGDLHLLQVTDGTRSIGRWTATLSDTTLDLGPPPATASLTLIASGATRRPRVSVPSQAAYGDAVSVWVVQQGPIAGTPYIGMVRSMTVTMTRGYVGTLPGAWTLEIPDLSNVAGIPTDHLLAPGGLRWSVSARGSSCTGCTATSLNGRVERSWSVNDTVR